MLTALFALLFFGPGASSAPASHCPIELAEYRVRGDPKSEVAFYPAEPRDLGVRGSWRLGVTLRIDLRPEGEDSWWVPLEPGSAGVYSMQRVVLRSGEAELARVQRHQFRYYLFDAKFDRIHEAPTRGMPAPAHLFLADLRSIFWYDPADHDQRMSPAEEMLDFARCAREREDAPPPDLIGMPPYA